MIILNPYDTSYGSLISIDKTIEDLKKFIAIKRSDVLNYEYRNTENVKFIFVTGKDEYEKELPYWEHPLVFKDMDGVYAICTDLRKYVTIKDDDFISLEEVIRDKNSVEFLIARSIVISDFIEKNIGTYKIYFNDIAGSFSVWLSSAINNIVALSPIEKVEVEIALNFYYHSLFYNEWNEDVIESISGNISHTKLSMPVNMKLVKSISSKLPEEVIGIQSMAEFIKAVLPENKQLLIDDTAILNTITNAWYGPGNSETIIMSLEHAPTWMALLYINVENKSFKRTRIAMMLDKYKRKFKFDNYIKKIDEVIENKKM